MSTRIGFRWLRAGHCLHPECIVQRGGRCRLERYPALVGLLLHPSRGPVLFDTGYSERFQEATSGFPERLYRWVTPVTLEEDEPLTVQLTRWGVHVEDVRHVVLGPGPEGAAQREPCLVRSIAHLRERIILHGRVPTSSLFSLALPRSARQEQPDACGSAGAMDSDAAARL